MDDLKNQADKWINEQIKDKFTFSLLGEDVSEQMLKFSVTMNGNKEQFLFSVQCPHDEHSNWMVWSESERLQSCLDTVLEFLDSDKDITIDAILDKLSVSLEQLAKSSDNTTDDDDDDDDEYDDAEDNDDDVGDEGFDYYEDVEAMNINEEDDSGKVDDNDEDEDDDMETFFGKGVNPTAFQRLAKDMRNMKKEAQKFGIEGSPRGDNLFIWDVKLTGFPKDTPLGKDITEWAKKYKREPVVYMEMQFPGNYPMEPPFVRVLRPRFRFLTGHVTIGGSICMEMLTRSGWTPGNDIESILVQIRSEILSDPNTRLDGNPDKEYGEAEARDAFRRMVDRYGWNR